MPAMIIRTWFSNGKEMQSSPCRILDGGYSTVAELRSELHRRWRNSYDVRDIPGGVELIPRPEQSTHCGHGKQEVTLDIELQPQLF